jgi:hypothetical protein
MKDKVTGLTKKKICRTRIVGTKKVVKKLKKRIRQQDDCSVAPKAKKLEVLRSLLRTIFINDLKLTSKIPTALFLARL